MASAPVPALTSAGPGQIPPSPQPTPKIAAPTTSFASTDLEAGRWNFVSRRGLPRRRIHRMRSIANGGMTAGLKVSLFLTSAGVDIARKRAADLTHVHPLEPLAALLKGFLVRGGTLWACTPCVK